MIPKNTICLWYENDALGAASFYAETFPDSSVGAVHRAPGDFPSGQEGQVLVVDFVVCGVPCMGLNGGPMFKFTEAVSFVVTCDNQEEIDYYWSKLTSDGGQEGQCGWLKDKYGLSWQVVPAAIGRLMSDPQKGPRVMAEVMKMKKLDLKRMEEA